MAKDRLTPYDLVTRVLEGDPLELDGRTYSLPEFLGTLGHPAAPASMDRMADALSQHLGLRVGTRTIIRWRNDNGHYTK